MKSKNFLTKFSKKTKLIISFSAVLLILFTGYLSISAKTGFFSTLADEIVQVTTGKITATISIVGSDSKPMLDGSVEVYNKDGMLYEIGKPDNKGQVRFLLFPANYSFSFVNPNCGATTGVVSVNSNSKNFTIKSQCKGGEESGAIKQKITIEGKITDSSNRENIKDAKVEIKSQDGKILKNTLSTDRVATEFTFNYSIADIPMGSYTVAVTHNDYESQTKNITAGWFREVGDNTWLSAEVSFQLKKKSSTPPPAVTPPSGNYNLPGDALTNQKTFTLYLSLKDELNKWISQGEKIGASITHSTDTTIKKSGQLSPLQNWPNKNIAYQGANMQANLTVLEIPISTKTGNYQIVLNKHADSKTDFNVPDVPIIFTKNDIKVLTNASGSKYAYFYYRYSLTKTETFDVMGTVKEEGTENLIPNVELKLTCDGKEVGIAKTAMISDDNKSNYVFADISKSYKKCLLEITGYDTNKYDSPSSSEINTGILISDNIAVRHLTIRPVINYIIAGIINTKDTHEPLGDIGMSLTCGETKQNEVSKTTIFNLSFLRHARMNYIFRSLKDSGVSHCNIEILNDIWVFPDGKNSMVIPLSTKSKSTYFITEGRYLIYVPLYVVKRYPETDKYFDVYGKVSYVSGSTNVPPGTKISIKIVNGVMEKTSEVMDVLFWPEDTNEKDRVANYLIPNIPFYEDAEYQLQLQLDAYVNATFSAVSGDTFKFSSKDIGNVRIGKSANSFQKDFIFEIDKLFHNLTVSFKDAATGQIIDINKEKIIRNKIYCLDKENIVRNCFEKTEILVSDPPAIRYIYFDRRNYSSVSEFLEFETENYLYAGHHLRNLGLQSTTVYLINKTDKMQSFVCYKINSIDFCTYKAIENEIFTAGRLKNLEKYAKFVTKMAEFIGIHASEYPDVYLTSSGEKRAFASESNGIKIGDFDSTTYFALDNSDIDNPKRGIETVVHEFGHIVDFYSGLNNKDWTKFNSALNAARGLNDDGLPILGSNGKAVNSCNDIFKKYRCFSNYAITTNTSELWAEFFTFWVLHNDQVSVALNDPEMMKPENAHCLNALKFLDFMMQSKFPKMKTFKSLETASTEGIVKAASTQNSNAEYFSLMRNMGFEEVLPRRYNTVAKFSDLSLSSSEIASGIWLKEKYDKLPVKEKATIQIQILSNQTKNLFSTGTTITSIKSSIANINTKIESWLVKLGFKISSTRVSGKIRDQYGPASNILVKIGSKSAVTDKNGSYTINRLEEGNLPVEISEPMSGARINDSNRILTLKKNQKLTNKNFVLYRNYYNVNGKAMIGDAPLAGGKIILNNGSASITRTITKDGTFSFQLPEGEYSYTIKNSKNKTLKITNPGFANDAKKIKIINKDLNGTIWVK